MNYVLTFLAVLMTTVFISFLDNTPNSQSNAPVFEVDSRNYIHMKNNEQNKRFLSEIMDIWSL